MPSSSLSIGIAHSSVIVPSAPKSAGLPELAGPSAAETASRVAPSATRSDRSPSIVIGAVDAPEYRKAAPSTASGLLQM